MTDKFASKLETQTVSTLITRLENKEDEKIILDPQYQRNIVWKVNDMCYFLNSIYCGIIPSNILFNVDANGNYVCMDGKQRLTSLLLFKQNKIFITANIDDNNIYIYYNTIPEKFVTNESYRIMTPLERNKFNQTPIPVITYTDLSYSDQTDVFHRIQHGKVLSAGEILLSLFSDDKNGLFFSKFCDNKNVVINLDTSRKDHVIEVINIMYITRKLNIFKKPSKSQREKYIKDFTRTNLPKETERVSKLIDIFYSDKLMNHCTIHKKDINIDLKYLTCKLVYDLFKNKYGSITDDEYKYIRSCIRKTKRDLNIDNKKNNQQIYLMMRSYYYDLVETNIIVSDIDNTQSDTDNDLMIGNESTDSVTREDI